VSPPTSRSSDSADDELPDDEPAVDDDAERDDDVEPREPSADDAHCLTAAAATTSTSPAATDSWWLGVVCGDSRVTWHGGITPTASSKTPPPATHRCSAQSAVN